MVIEQQQQNSNNSDSDENWAYNCWWKWKLTMKAGGTAVAGAQQWNLLNLLRWCASLSPCIFASVKRLFLATYMQAYAVFVCACMCVMGRAVSLRVGAEKWNIDNLNAVARKQSVVSRQPRSQQFNSFQCQYYFHCHIFSKAKSAKQKSSK